MKSRVFLLVIFFSGVQSLVFARSPGGDCSFSGTVVDAASKKPVANVTIVARGIKRIQKFITNEQGQFRIPVSADSTYTFTFEKSDYKPVEKKNIVIKDNAANVSIELLQKENGIENHHNWLLKVNFQ